MSIDGLKPVSESPVNIVRADMELFRKYQDEILQIEKDQIENSSSAYFFDREDELSFMTEAIEKGGYALLAMEEDRVNGFLVVGPLADGSELPPVLRRDYPVEKSLHVKVMYMKSPGQGLGSALMNELIDGIDRNKWNYLFVRTWIDPPNLGAIRFYAEKMGLAPVDDAIVESEKLAVDRSHSFRIKRQYFVRDL